MPREKKVFTDLNEIAHMWAYQMQDYARNPSDNFYFQGKTIYSYGSHYPIATIFEQEDKGTVVLFNDSGYSNTTSKHIWIVKAAMPNWWTVLYMQEFPEPKRKKATKWFKDSQNEKHKKNITNYLTIARQAAEKYPRARSNKDLHAVTVKGNLDQAKQYIEYFKCKNIFTKAEKSIIFDVEEQEKLLEGVSLFDEATKRAAERREKMLKQAYKERREKLKKELAEWRAFERRTLYGQSGYYLRLHKRSQTIETSTSASITVEQAKIVWGALKNCVENKRTFEPKRGEGPRLNEHYRIDKITKEGTLTVGCHVIVYEELEAIAKELNWI